MMGTLLDEPCSPDLPKKPRKATVFSQGIDQRQQKSNTMTSVATKSLMQQAVAVLYLCNKSKEWLL